MKIIIALIILLGLAWGGYTLIDSGENQMTTPTNETENEEVTPPASTGSPTIREINVTASNFTFSTSTIKVNRGDTVRIVLKNQGGSHDWVIDEFDARTKVLANGQSETIEFVADKTGSFEYYCSVGTHRQMGMKGTLIVE